MPETVQVATLTRWMRRVEGKFQNEFSSEIHLCEKSIRNLEHITANPRLKTLKALADYAAMSISDFLDISPLNNEILVRNEPVRSQDISSELLTLSLWIKVFRKLYNESQLVFSGNVGVSLDTINRLERRLPSCNPTLSILQKIAAYMSVTVSGLLDTFLISD